MKRHITKWKALFAEVFYEFVNDKVLKFSAALAYYTIFSLPPMLIIIISVTGRIYGRQAIEGKVYAQIANYVGPSSALQIQDMIKNIHLSGNSYIATIIGFVTLLIGATGVFTEIQDSINTIWGIKAKPKKGWLALLINRLISFSMILSIGFLLVVSLIANTLIEAVGERINEFIPGVSSYLLLISNYSLTFLIITLLFGTIYKVLPDARIGWRDVIIGAIATAILFMIGKFGIGFYLHHSKLSTTYGAAGSIVIILVWVYYSSIILYFGAEFTQIYAKHFGKRIIPKEYAVLVEKTEIKEHQL